MTGVIARQAAHYAARAAAKTGQIEHRSVARAWHVSITHPGDTFGGQVTEWTDLHLPTVLSVDYRCNCFIRRDEDPCLCVGDLMYRGACLGCPWEGPVTYRENEAVEDAHDHTHPGWRNLPVLDITMPERPTAEQLETATTTGRMNSTVKAWTAYIAKVTAASPAHWPTVHGPIRTARQPYGGRHVPGRSPFGGYDLAAPLAPTHPEPNPAELAFEQLALI